MTSCCPPATQEVSTAFRHLLAQQGVDDVRGVELLRRVRAVNNAFDGILAETPLAAAITPQRWRVLLRIWQEEQMGRPAVNPTHLSRAQQVSKNTISDHLRWLEEAGLIVRELDSADRRQFKIALTDAGRTLVQTASPAHVRLLNQLVAGMPEKEIDTLLSLLDRLHGALLENAQQAKACPDQVAWQA